MVEQSLDTIEVLEEILGSLRIIKNNMSNWSTELATSEIEEMSTALVIVMYNKNILIKSIVPNLG